MAKNSIVDEWYIDWDNKEIHDYGKTYYLHKSDGDIDKFYEIVLRLSYLHGQNEFRQQMNELMRIRRIR